MSIGLYAHIERPFFIQNVLVGLLYSFNVQSIPANKITSL